MQLCSYLWYGILVDLVLAACFEGYRGYFLPPLKPVIAGDNIICRRTFLNLFCFRGSASTAQPIVQSAREAKRVRADQSATTQAKADIVGSSQHVAGHLYAARCVLQTKK